MTHDPVDHLRARYLKAQLAGDRREALRLVSDEARSLGLSVGQVQLRVIQEAQREIGQLWQENRISIAQEHMATAIAQLALAHVYQAAPGGAQNGKKVTVSCVEGELHAFPAQLVADTLDLAGYQVRFLGANVPTDGLVAMLAGEPADLLALSCTMTFNVPALRDAVRGVRKSQARRVPILVGGNALEWSPDLRTTLDVDGFGKDASEMLARTDGLLGILRD